MRIEYLKQAWLVLALALGFGGALAFVDRGLADKIEQNKQDETLRTAPSLVGQDLGDPAGLRFVPAKGKGQSYTVKDSSGADRLVIESMQRGEDPAVKDLRVCDMEGKTLGWVIRGSGQGFADKIELLVGLDASGGQILGMSVLDQKETPGLGDKVRSDPAWAAQFQGKGAVSDVGVSKTPPAAGSNDIQAVTGATISSTSVCRIVNTAIIAFRNARVAGAASKAAE